MVRHYEKDPGSQYSLSLLLRLDFIFVLQAEHLSFPLQAQSSGRTSNLELNAKFKVRLLVSPDDSQNLFYHF